MSHIFPIEAPYPFFTNLTGEALDAGKIYIGVAGLDAETNPINAYWDDGLTVVANQPIRTVVGLPVNGGTPSTFFSAVDFSITVRDVNDKLMYSKLSLDDTAEPDPDVFDPTPLAVIVMGSSNSAVNANATGGNRDIPEDVFAWNSNQHAGSGVYVPGTQFNPAEFGVKPLNAGSGLANSLALQTAINLKNTTNRPVYFIIVALGGQSPESFITALTRTANGWTLPGGDEDMTLQYDNAKIALAAIPGGKAAFDHVLWFQTQGTGVGRVDYQPKFAAILDDMETSGISSRAVTQVAAFVSPPGTSNRETHLVSLYSEAKLRPNLAIGDTAGLDTTDGVHFSGDACTTFGRRAHDVLLSARSMSGQAIMLSDESDSDQLSYTYLEHSSGDSAVFKHADPNAAVSAAVIPNSNVGTVRFEINEVQIASFGAGGLQFPAGDDRMEAYERLNDLSLEIADAATGGNVSSTPWLMRKQLVGRDLRVYGRASAISTVGMTGTNELFFRGLPNGGMADQQNLPAAGSVLCDFITHTVGYTQFNVEVEHGTDYFRIIETGSNVASRVVLVSQITSGVSLLRSFEFTYRINDPLAP